MGEPAVAEMKFIESTSTKQLTSARLVNWDVASRAARTKASGTPARMTRRIMVRRRRGIDSHGDAVSQRLTPGAQ
jgi:hypothetical protein